MRGVELLQTLVGQANSMDQAIDSFIWNSLILRHEADRLGIAPTRVSAVLPDILGGPDDKEHRYTRYRAMH